MKKILLIAVALLIVYSNVVQAKHLHPEKYYQNVWCSQNCGAMEIVLPDKARVDCLTNTYAVEVDFAPKWAESIGQALYYANELNLKPAVLLIMEDPIKDEKYLNRLNKVADKYGITVFTIKP